MTRDTQRTNSALVRSWVTSIFFSRLTRARFRLNIQLYRGLAHIGLEPLQTSLDAQS
jgi:hypothetical protein